MPAQMMVLSGFLIKLLNLPCYSGISFDCTFERTWLHAEIGPSLCFSRGKSKEIDPFPEVLSLCCLSSQEGLSP